MGLCIFPWYQYCELLVHYLPHKLSNNMIAQYNTFIFMYLDEHQNN